MDIYGPAHPYADPSQFTVCLVQKEEALAVLAGEKRQLQADLRLMLQAKAALAALAGGLHGAAGGVAGSVAV